jgi:hypothetical protein
MSSKKTYSKKAVAPKAPVKKSTAKKGPKAVSKDTGPRHPRGRVATNHGGKEALAKALASSLATGGEDADTVAGRLKTASNSQLLHLQRVVEMMKQKWGSRDKLIAAITDATKAGKDKDYVAKLGTFSLPRLVDLANSAARRARA